MKTLDRYIVRNFVFAVVLWFAILLSLRVIGDMFVKLDEFTEQKLGFGGTMQNIASYYGHQSLVYFAQLGGVIIVIAAGTTLAIMNRTNELTAILASGVSLHRVVWPIVLCAMLMGGLIIFDQEILIPRVAHQLVRSPDDVAGTEEFAVRLITDGQNDSWYSQSFTAADQILRKPLVFLRDKEFNTLGLIRGETGRHSDSGEQRGWLISDGVLVRAGTKWRNTPSVEKVYTNLSLEEILQKAQSSSGKPIPGDQKVFLRPIIIHDGGYGLWIEAESLEVDPVVPGRPRQGRLIEPKFTFAVKQGPAGKTQTKTLGQFRASSATWQPKQTGDDENNHWALADGVLFCPSDLTGEDLILRRSSRWLDYMSTSQLNRLMKLQRVPEATLLIRHIRFTEPINNLIMLLLGVPFVLSRERRIKASIAMGLLMVGTFFAFIYACRYMDLPPTLAAWLPILLFGPVAVLMVDSVKT